MSENINNRLVWKICGKLSAINAANALNADIGRSSVRKRYHVNKFDIVVEHDNVNHLTTLHRLFTADLLREGWVRGDDFYGLSKYNIVYKGAQTTILVGKVYNAHTIYRFDVNPRVG